MKKSKKKKVKLPFRSKFEQTIAEQLDNSDVQYEYENEEKKIEYVIPVQVRRYLPDFSVVTRSGKQFFIEAKGIWDYQDRLKHLFIKQQHPEIDIRFVFQRAGQRIRKSSKTTYRDLCEGRGRGIWKDVTWLYSEGKVPKEWLEE